MSALLLYGKYFSTEIIWNLNSKFPIYEQKHIPLLLISNEIKLVCLHLPWFCALLFSSSYSSLPWLFDVQGLGKKAPHQQKSKTTKHQNICKGISRNLNMENKLQIFFYSFLGGISSSTKEKWNFIGLFEDSACLFPIWPGLLFTPWV